MTQATATVHQLTLANHLNCSVLGNAIAEAAPKSSKMLITEFSTPAKLDLSLAGTIICVSCCVVRSYTHTPSRDRARKPKRTTLNQGLIEGDGSLPPGASPPSGRAVSFTFVALDMAHKASTTGICQGQ